MDCSIVPFFIYKNYLYINTCIYIYIYSPVFKILKFIKITRTTEHWNMSFLKINQMKGDYNYEFI